MSQRTIDAVLHATEYARARGVSVTFEPGWETRSGTKAGRDSNPEVIYWHHTGGDNTSVAYLRDGDPARGLGCLANAAVLRGGTIHILSAKYTNTEGYNDKEAHEALKDGRAPLDRQVVPASDEEFSANSLAFGIEVIDRGDAWEPHVYDATLAFTAGLVEGYGFSKSNPPVGGHKEITKRKVDPWYDMAMVRRHVRDLLAGAAPTPSTPQPAPAEPLVTSQPRPQGYTNPHVPLRTDGNWGPATTRALQHCLASKYNARGLGGQRLAVNGEKGPHTYRALQRVLNQQGRYGLAEGGNFGPRSKVALQHYLRVRSDGDIGPNTIRALQSMLNNNTF